MLLFVFLFTIVINLWHQKFVTADVIAVFVNKQHGIQRQKQNFDKKSLYLKRYIAKRLTYEFPEKSWTKHGVNKLLKNLRDIDTVDIATTQQPALFRATHILPKKITMPLDA